MTTTRRAWPTWAWPGVNDDPVAKSVQIPGLVSACHVRTSVDELTPSGSFRVTVAFKARASVAGSGLIVIVPVAGVLGCGVHRQRNTSGLPPDEQVLGNTRNRPHIPASVKGRRRSP